MELLKYSRNTLTTAMCVAVLTHAALFAVPIMKIEREPNIVREFVVSFLEEPALDEVKPDTVEPVEQTQPEVDIQTPVEAQAKPLKQRLKVPDDIVVINSGKQPEPRIKVETTVSSTSFKAWLEADTQAFTSRNPGLVDNFDETFAPKPIYTSPPELDPDNPKSRPAGSTTFAVEKNGKRSCMVRIINMLDASAGPSFVSKDCTPPKKFELDMNKPNNGWMDR